jgi:hypothetical protein
MHIKEISNIVYIKMMNLPMLVIIHGNPLYNSEELLAKWEETVTAIVKADHSEKYAEEVIKTAKAQLELMESWLRPDEIQIFVTLKMPWYQLEIGLQRFQTKTPVLSS